MKKINLITFYLLVISGVALHAQEIKSSKNGSIEKEWFMDSQGKVNPNSKYTFISFTPNSNIIKVKYDQKYGLIDRAGNEITPISYDGIQSFSSGLAVVNRDNLYGLINEYGKEITPLKYWDITIFKEGIIFAQSKYKFGIIDKTGKEIAPLKYDNLIYISEGLIAFNVGGKWDLEDYYFYTDNVFNWEGKWGFIDKAGKELITAKYDAVYDIEFKNGVSLVSIGGEIDKNGLLIGGKLGIVNSNGMEIVSVNYDFISAFMGEIALINIGAKINEQGQPYGGKWGAVNKLGKVLVPLKYDYISRFEEGIAYVNVGFRTDENGQVISNGRWGVIKASGIEVISPMKYDGLSAIAEGLFLVALNGKYGYVDKNGNVVIRIQYEAAEPFENDRAKVVLNTREFYIDKAGKEIKP